MLVTTTFRTLVLALPALITASAVPQTAPPGVPLPNRIPCNTTTIVNNPVCAPEHACIPDPDIFCTQPVPKTCLDGMCVPYLKDTSCGGFVIEPKECNGEQTCVENVIENCADCSGYCVWKDGRDAQVGGKPKA